jgi:hypothetical protein
MVGNLVKTVKGHYLFNPLSVTYQSFEYIVKKFGDSLGDMERHILTELSGIYLRKQQIFYPNLVIDDFLMT